MVDSGGPRTEGHWSPDRWSDRPDARYALGDLVGYAPWPNEVLERLRAEGFPIVMGNYDDGTGFERDECGCAYTDPAEKALGDEDFAWTKAHTIDGHKAWLRTLAPEIRFEADGRRFLLVHGSPRRRLSTCTRTSPTRRSRGSPPAPTPTSSSAATPTGRMTNVSGARASSTWARPASPRTATRAPAGRCSTPPPRPSTSAASNTTLTPPRGGSRSMGRFEARFPAAQLARPPPPAHEPGRGARIARPG